MATRFYLDQTGAPAFIPAFSAGWEVTGQGTRSVLTTMKPGDATIASRSDSTGTDEDVIAVQFTSGPMTAQTISGFVKGQIRASASNADDDWRAQMRVYVVSGDGATVRGVLLDFDESALTSEFSAAVLTNRKFPLAWTGSGAALTPVNAEDGDRLVVEIGARTHVAGSGNSYSLEFRANATSDLPEDETSTDPFNSWVEFDHNFSLKLSDAEAVSRWPKSVAFPNSIPGRVPHDGSSTYSLGDLEPSPVAMPAQIRKGGSGIAFAPGTGAAGGVQFRYKMRGVDSGAPAPGYVTWEADVRDYAGAQSATAEPPIVGSLVGGSVVVVSQWEMG